VQAHGVALHAYVLSPTQIRLLATPKDAEGIGRAMQAIGRRYVLHLNGKTGRTGALWQRRFRSTLIDAHTFLIPTMRLIEQQPVREGLAPSPDRWRWSSHGHHAGREQAAFISDHAAYWALSDTPFERQAIYRGLVEVPIEPAFAARIDASVERGWILGDAAFVAAIDGQLNRRGTPLPRGRPRKLDMSPINEASRELLA
jgi:putative transposase